VFSFTFKANFAASLCCTALGIPYVTNVTGLGTAFLSDRARHRAIRRFYSFANRRAYATFFQNDSDRDLFRQSGLSTGHRSAVLPGSGVDTDHFAFDRLDRPVRVFLMIARLIRDKGVIEYLQAARIAKAARPELRFRLVGPIEASGADGIGLDEVLSYRDAVDYLGELDDVRPALRASECLVLPSYREGMPRTVLEAASTGRVALVSDVEGCRDAIVPGKTGFLFPVRSARGLAEAALWLAGREACEITMMSERARALAVERFSERHCIEPYIGILREIEAAGAMPLAEPEGIR
jgi:glycosyltransferase involved in cell wall biosynthesis